jgi:hypothetical protein
MKKQATERRSLCGLFFASFEKAGKSHILREFMFLRFSTLRKSGAVILPVCLLWLHFGCISICSHHLEEVLKADARSVTVCDTDENCPITAAVVNALPERSFLSSAAVGAAHLMTPVRTVEFAYDISPYQLESFLSPSPPSERLCVLRI